MRTCAHCGININGKRAGARYCSTSCRVMGNRAPKLPNVMTGSARWVTWEPVERREGTGKRPTRVDGRPASVTDPTTWATYEEVAQCARKGWVLGNGVGCIDLDHCLNEAGIPAGWARAVLEEHRAEAVWVEISPSGRGLHVFVPMGAGPGRVIRDGRNIEVYPPGSGRFVCVTGRCFRF